MRGSRESSDDGFTLLEVMAVVLVLGILVAIAVGSYTFSVDRSYRVTCQMNQRTLNSAVLLYEQQHGSMPADLSAIGGLVAGSKDLGRCPKDRTVDYDYDPLTGQVSCPLHPMQ